MKRIYDSEKNCMMAIDGEYEFELGWCKSCIKAWKGWYFKKNSKIKTLIQLRCNHQANDPMFWKYYLELTRKGKTAQRIRICEEAYDVLKTDKPLEGYSQIEFVTIEQIN